MVAPIQGTIGKTATDSVTQDYLTELNNFYAKPENEGVKSEFVAPDGSKYDITDSSYLSRVTTNVNTGKLDAPAAKEPAKTVDANADMSLEPQDKKTAKTTDDSEYAKTKAKSENAVGNASDAASSSKDAGSNAESSQKGQGTVEGVDTKADPKGTSGANAIAAKLADDEKSKAKTEESKKKLKESNKIAKQEDAKLTAQTQKIRNGFKEAMNKLDAKMEAKKAEKSSASEAPEEMTEEADTQSGSKMGFEGKLMTTADAVSTEGTSSTDEAWAKTMEGPKNQLNGNFTKQTAELQNVKAAGDKAADTFNQQAASTDQAAAQKLDAAQGKTWGASATFVGAAAGATEAVVQLGAGVQSTTTGTTLVTTGTPPSVVPATAPAGLATIASGVVSHVKGFAHYIKTALGFLSAVAGFVSGAVQLKAANKDRDEKEKLNQQADAQREQGAVARKKAVADTNKMNAQTLQATSNVNAMMSSLGNSELPSITVENQEQFEVVKKDRYDQIMAHEQEHAAVIGGSPVITTDSNGVAIAGYVAINVPSVDESDLEGTMERAQKVIDAALAPSDPSSQDKNIASQAKSVLERAQSLLEEKAKNSKDKKDEAKKEEPKVEEPKTEVKDELRK